MNKYNRLKELSKLKQPIYNHEYQNYIWIYKNKIGEEKKILLKDIFVLDLSKYFYKTKNASWNDIYAEHYRVDWVKAFSAELKYRRKVQKWFSNRLEISILKKTNNK